MEPAGRAYFWERKRKGNQQLPRRKSSLGRSGRGEEGSLKDVGDRKGAVYEAGKRGGKSLEKIFSLAPYEGRLKLREKIRA